MHPSETKQGINTDFSIIDLNRLTLAFNGILSSLEIPFRQHYTHSTLARTRVAFLLGALMYGCFGLLDQILLQASDAHLTWMIRYAIICPYLLLVCGLTYIQRLEHYLQHIMASATTFAGLGIVYMIHVIPPPVSYYYYTGLILVFIFGYCFINLRFLWASLSGWIIVIAYELTAYHAQIPSPVLMNNSFFIISANIAGMLVCYAIEYTIRRNYYLMHLLAEGQRKISEANEQLEQRVSERTSELVLINRQLRQEINERQMAEQKQRRLENQLKQAEKMEAIGSLAAGVAHDLNNILVGLVTLPDLMLLKLPPESPLRDDIIKLQNSGKRAAAIVQDLLTMARMGIAERTVTNLNKLINEYLQSPEYQKLEQEHPHLHTTVSLQDDLLNCRASSVQLTKAVMNLVTNAYEATLIEGAVTIATANRYLDTPLEALETIPCGEYIVLSIRDTGVGIAENDRQRIFEPFYTKKRLGRSGTGLGMTVVWNTVKEMQGYIDVRSTEGKGTEFDLYLPVSRDEMHYAPAKISIDDCRGSERVLVVDDDPEQRDTAAAILGQLGYCIMTAASGEEAVELIKSQPVDIVVLDMIMDPGIDGLETYRRMREIRPELKAIIVSGFSETEQVKEVQQMGAGSYVKKPYTLEKIALAIRSEMQV